MIVLRSLLVLIKRVMSLDLTDDRQALKRPVLAVYLRASKLGYAFLFFVLVIHTSSVNIFLLFC